MTDTPKLPKYLERLLTSGWHPSPGELIEVDVRHDADCALWRGDDCTCSPDVVEMIRNPSTRKDDANV